MAMRSGPKEYSVLVAEDSTTRLVCRTEGFKYTPDTLRYVYGKSTRRPLEDWFLEAREARTPTLPKIPTPRRATC